MKVDKWGYLTRTGDKLVYHLQRKKRKAHVVKQCVV